MTKRMEEIFRTFMEARFEHDKPEDSYYQEWRRRFEGNKEWMLSDESNRRMLQAIAPEIYPKDVQSYFVRE